MKLRHTLFILSTMIGAASCASISAPEGGPKDETAPNLISSNPKDQALNVSSKTITLTFDEEVQQNNLTSQLLITPNTQNKFKVDTDKNQLTLEFENPLLENTTYTLNFREGVTDITEKNKAQDLRLSFSTGSYIDSSMVSGTVVNLRTQKPEPKAIVGLYPTDDTLSIRKNRPYYQTETDQSGSFKITNVKSGDYNIYALVDKNKNSFYDTEEEKIAYLPKPINVSPTTEPIQLQLVKLDTKKPILLRRENFTDRFVANYNEGIEKFTANLPGTPKQKLPVKIGIEGKAIEVFKSSDFVGGKTIFTAVDSAGNIATDTVDIKFEGKRAQRIKGATLKVINTTKTPGTYAVGEQVIVELETPIRITGKAPISIKADTVIVKELTYPDEVSLDSTRTELSFSMPKVNGRNRQLSIVLDSTMIKPLEGQTLNLRSLPITLEENGGTGTVTGTVETKYPSFTVQLLNTEFKLVREIRDKKSFQFKNLPPGNYQIRVLIDENNNKIWETGTPDFKTGPEKVYFYPKPIDVRANWEVEGIQLEF